ncbi:hypothetical protein MKEN_00272500 [Mycena kentingensis (nom. inval.)]|nr:hypothetical protein MKEN_00272500 [Mycena kentingensis (nom. inval.)]
MQPRRYNGSRPALRAAVASFVRYFRRQLQLPVPLASDKTKTESETPAQPFDPQAVYLQLGDKTRLVPTWRMRQHSYPSVQRYVRTQFPETREAAFEIAVDMPADGRKDVVITEEAWPLFVRQLVGVPVAAYTIRLVTTPETATTAATPPSYPGPAAHAPPADGADEEDFPLTIQLITGKRIPLRARASDTIASLRVQISGAEDAGHPAPHQQRIVFHGRERDRRATLRDCGIGEGDRVYMVLNGGCSCGHEDEDD